MVRGEARLRRKQERQIRRGKLISAIHPHAFNQLRNKLTDIDFTVAIGHGTLVRQGTATVPSNVLLIFTTRPGYWGNMKDTVDPKFLNIFMNPDKIRKFFRNTLPKSELPDLVTERKWNWKSHVYPPGSELPEHGLEFIDKDRGTPLNIQRHGLHTQYDDIAGLYHVPEPRQFYGTALTLSQILNITQAKAVSTGRPRILIFSGCRGDPVMFGLMSIVQALRRTSSGKHLLQKPQTYPIPKHEDEFVEKLQKLENNTSKSMYRKRLFNENFIKRRILSLKTNENKQKFISKYKNFFKNKNAQQYIKKIKKNAALSRIGKIIRKGVVHPLRMQKIRSRASKLKRNIAQNRLRKAIKSVIKPKKFLNLLSNIKEQNRYRKLRGVLGYRTPLYSSQVKRISKLPNNQKRNAYINLDETLLRKYLSGNTTINDSYIKRLGNRIKNIRRQNQNLHPIALHRVINNQKNMSNRNKFVMKKATTINYFRMGQGSARQMFTRR